MRAVQPAIEPASASGSITRRRDPADLCLQHTARTATVVAPPAGAFGRTQALMRRLSCHAGRGEDAYQAGHQEGQAPVLPVQHQLELRAAAADVGGPGPSEPGGRRRLRAHCTPPAKPICCWPGLPCNPAPRILHNMHSSLIACSTSTVLSNRGGHYEINQRKALLNHPNKFELLSPSTGY